MSRVAGFLIAAIVLVLFVILRVQNITNGQHETGIFIVEHELQLPGTPFQIYDAMTGDISGWWDRSFSPSPAKLYIEARPGGGFYEILDDSGDGLLHATVTAAQRGQLLRLEGSLGLAGHAIQMVTSLAFSAAVGDSTTLRVSVHAAGEMQDVWAETVSQVWGHLLFERLRPHVLEGKHLRHGSN